MRKAQLIKSSALSLALFGTAACGPQGERCAAGSCPDISGVYSLQSSNVNGQCGFVPLLPGPSLVLEQTEDGTQVLATFIDPVNQLEVALSGELLVSGDTPEAVNFVMVSRFPRVTGLNSTGTVDMSVTFAGTVRLGEVRQLSGTLTNTSLPQPGQSVTNPDGTTLNPGANTPNAGIGGATPTPIDTAPPTGTFDTSGGITGTGSATAGGPPTTTVTGTTTTGGFPAAATTFSGAANSCTTTISFTALGQRKPAEGS